MIDSLAHLTRLHGSGVASRTPYRGMYLPICIALRFLPARCGRLCGVGTGVVVLLAEPAGEVMLAQLGRKILMTFVVATERPQQTFAMDPMDRPANTEKLVPALPPLEGKQAVELFKLLADETRLRILCILKDRGELHVQALCRILQQTQPAVSHHLGLLRVAGLVKLRREGKHNFYHVLSQPFADMAEALQAFIPGDASWHPV